MTGKQGKLRNQNRKDNVHQGAIVKENGVFEKLKVSQHGQIPHCEWGGGKQEARNEIGARS